MDPLTLLTIVSSFASLGGYSIRDAIKKSRRITRGPILFSTIRLLSIFEAPDDPLVGIWSLKQWKYKYELHSGYHVSGKLAILYKDNSNQTWRGFIFLRYQRRLSRFLLFSPEGYLARLVGYCIDGVYDVEIRLRSKRNFVGSTTLTYRNPGRSIFDSGEFRVLTLGDGATLNGKFQNTNTKGSATFSFHQRRRWKEMADGP